MAAMMLKNGRAWIPVFTGTTEGNIRCNGLWSVSLSLWLLFASTLHAAPTADLWPRWQKNDPANQQKIDHAAWDKFLKKYVVAPHPSGIYRLRYKEVTQDDRRALQTYLSALQQLRISNYSPSEQKAYWINLYNAATVDLILGRYPVASIRDINIFPGLFTRGPWGAKLLTLEGEKLSLDDIEHRILRPIWLEHDYDWRFNSPDVK